jgi:radical SAM protein with 4Fe4S-binding SPASM domain
MKTEVKSKTNPRGQLKFNETVDSPLVAKGQYLSLIPRSKHELLRFVDIFAYRLLPTRTLKKAHQHWISSLLRNEAKSFNPRTDLFQRIQIQTVTGCNYSCGFCPANKDGLDMPEGEMSLDLYMKVMRELREIGYRGTIIYNLQNEPLMDKRLPELTRLAREHCPESFIQTSSNGAYLTRELLVALVDAGMEKILVNDYTKTKAVIQRVDKFGVDDKYLAALKFPDRDWAEVYDPGGYGINNRAGNLVGQGFPIPAQPLHLFCTIPFNIMTVGFDGRVLLCCQDWQFQEIVGDLRRNTLVEIWDSPKFNEVRAMLLQMKRDKFLCSKCDYVGY